MILGDTRAEIKPVDASEATGHVMEEKQEAVGGRRKMGKRRESLVA